MTRTDSRDPFGAVSQIGVSLGSPYTAQVLENTMLRQPACNMALRSESEPPTLFS
jgi:hypothetical protein